MKYRSDIDGLRAVAVIPVVLFHAGISQISGGFVGVDVFFVISGYLITGLILEAAFFLPYLQSCSAHRLLPVPC
jgi:peptidoglycan/LPS O-acetylase OafA/YrhL